MTGILVPIALFLVIGFIIWVSVERKIKRDAQQHEQIMAAIEKGIYQPPRMKEVAYRKERYLLTGLLLSGVGLAFLLYALMEERDAIIAGFLFLFPGLGLMGFYYSLAKKEEIEAANNRALKGDLPS